MRKSNLNGCTFYNLRWLLPLLAVPLLVFGGVVRYDDMVLNSSLKIGGSAVANSKSAMEVTSTTKGILIPRMTTTQRDAISGPPTSLMIFNTTTGLYEYWNGVLWAPMGGASSVTGPATSTNNAIAVWSGTTGTLLKDSLLTVSGSTITGNLTGNVTGAVTGNASTATALAADPTDCAANTYAGSIDAGGNLTCSTVTNAGLAGSIAASKLIGSDIATVGTITSGTWSGTTILPTKGGTGFSTYTLGDTLYSDAANSLAKLTGNITTTKKFLSQTGNGSVSAAPAWGQPLCADISNASASCATDATNATNITSGTLAVAEGGTGRNSLTNHGLLIGATTTAITQSAVGATGTVLIGNTSADPTFSTGPIGLTSLGVNDSGATSATYLKTSAIGVPTLTLKAIGSQSADMMQILDSSASPQMIFTSGGNFKFFHNAATPEARFDIRPSINQATANAGNNARYSMFVGDPTNQTTNTGGGIAFGGYQDAGVTATEFGYIWVNKNNSSAGDIGASMHFATRNNSTGNAQRALEIDSSGNADFFSSINLNGSTSGKITTKAQAAAGTYEWDYPTSAGSSGNFLTSAGGAGSPMTWTSVVPIAAGGTNNGSLAVTAGGPLYTDGSKVINLGAGTAGQVIKSTGSAIQWGAANGGLISDREMISNTDIEVDTTGYTTYADGATATPVDCTGGSPVSTISRSTTTPITGTGELLWTKAGFATRQGEGVSIPFTIGAADQSKVLQLDIDSIVRSGTFAAGTSSTDSDLEFYIYDITNSTLIQPTTYKMYSNSTTGAFHTVSNFQTSATGTSYRLCVHTATAVTTNFTVGFDNISIHPSKLMDSGPEVSFRAYKAAAQTGINMSNGVVKAVFDTKSTDTTGSFDTTNSRFVAPVAGRYVFQTGIQFAGTNVLTTQYGIRFYKNGSLFELTTDRNPTSGGAFALAATSSEIDLIAGDYIEVDIYGAGNNSASTIGTSGGSNSQWFSGNKINGSNGVGGATETVAFTAYRATNQTGVNPNNTKVKISIDTITNDSHNAFSTANNNYVVPVSGYYVYTGCIAVATTNVLASLYRPEIFKNGVSIYDGATYQMTASQAFNSCMTTPPLLMAAGDTIDIRLLGTGNNSASTLTVVGSAADTYLSGFRVSAPNAIPPTATVAARYFASSTTPGTSASPLTVTYSTKDFDTHAAYASGTYTIPVAGKYQINAGALQTATTAAANQVVALFIYKNGSAVTGTQTFFTSATSKPLPNSLSDVLNCAAGDTITIRAGNDGTTPAMSASNFMNYFSIVKVGN